MKYLEQLIEELNKSIEYLETDGYKSHLTVINILKQECIVY